MATGALTVPLLEKIGHPRIRVAYDTANCEFYGDTKAVDDLAIVLPYLSNMHLKDKRGGKGVWDFPEPGAGHVDFAAILAILRDGGYEGPASVEIEFDGTWPDLEAHRQRRRRRARAPEGRRLRRRMIGIAILGGGFMGDDPCRRLGGAGRPLPGAGRRLADARPRRRRWRRPPAARTSSDDLEAAIDDDRVSLVDVCLPTAAAPAVRGARVRRRQGRAAGEAARADARGRRGDPGGGAP